MRLPATLAQRLAASSGMMTLANIPELYGAYGSDVGSQGKGIGGPPHLTGEPAVQNLAELDGAGGGAPGAYGAGAGGLSFPTAEAISSPGRSGGGANALRNFVRPERDGSEFGGGAYGITNRESEMMRRGRAPFTLDGVLTAFGNAYGLLSGPVMAGLGSMGELGFGLPQGTLGGIKDIPGWSRYDPDLQQAVQAGRMRLSEAEAIQRERESAGGGTVRGGINRAANSVGTLAGFDALGTVNPVAGNVLGALRSAVSSYRGPGLGGGLGGGGENRGGGRSAGRGGTTGRGGIAGEQRGSGRATY